MSCDIMIRAMVSNTIPTITALEAQAVANLYLSEYLPDRFTAGSAHLDRTINVWRVPILLAYPAIGPVGQVGEVIIDAASEELLSCTPVDEMKAVAQTLYEKHRDEIEAQVL